MLLKGVKFEWSNTERNAFEEIKQAFKDAPTLFLIRPKFKFGIYIDAAKSGLGARLYQYDEENKEYTVSYASRSLKGAEINYTITELECLALVWALRKWNTILMERKVRVHTDNKALNFVSSCAQHSERIAR